MLRELGEQVESVVLDGIGRTTSRIQERKPLPVDLLESDEAYLAVFDAPGITREEIDVRFDDRTIHARIDRARDTYEAFDMRLPGRGMSLSGSVSLPTHASIDPETATATLTSSGTLQVTLPKTEPDTTDEPIRIDTAADESEASEESDESSEDSPSS